MIGEVWKAPEHKLCKCKNGPTIWEPRRWCIKCGNKYDQ